MMGKPKICYTVVGKKNGKTVAHGTARECASKMGMTVHAFRNLCSYAYTGKHKRYEVFREMYEGRAER